MSATASASGTGTGAGGSGGGGGGGGGSSNSGSIKDIKSGVVWPDFPGTQSIAGNFGPIIAARVFISLMSAMYSQLHSYDSVRQLTEQGGISGPALAGAGSIATGIIGAGGLVANIGAGFSAGLTQVDTNHCDGAVATMNNLNPCQPRLAANPWVLDVVLCTLIIQAVVVLYAIVRWFKKPGGLSADPTTIGGVAVVMGHPEVEVTFTALPGEISNAELQRRLKGTHFKLGTFETEAGMTKYGIMPVPLSERKKNIKGIEHESVWEKLGEGIAEFRRKMPFSNSWQKGRLMLDIFFTVFILALLGLTITAVVYVDRPQVIFLAAVAASAVWMRVFFAILGVIISLYWGKMFQDAQTFTPYLPLGTGEARPNPTILLSRHSIPFTAFFPLLRNRHFAAASVAFISIISEFLIVFLAGLPYRPGQLRTEFLICGIGSAIILVLMLIELILISLWRRSLPHLPRQPDTVGAVMTYVAGTHMVRDFDGLESLSTKKRNEEIRKLNKIYAYGWRKEESGRVRWVVDQVAGHESKNLMDRTSDEGLEYHSRYGHE